MLDLVRRARPVLLGAAALLMALAIALPLWGMTLVSTQYPEGLRMIVYPGHITGDLREINALNRYIGMTPIADGFFTELRFLPIAFAAVAAVALATAFIRRRWVALVPLLMMAGLAAFGFWTMTRRLHQFGHDLDPTAPITIDPFTPPMVGLNQIAQFATYSYFSWGTFLPLTAGVLVALVLWADLRGATSRAGLPGLALAA